MKKYFQSVDRALRRYPRNKILAIAFLLAGIISAIDYWVGYEISTSLFFLVPVALATWYVNQRQGIYLSILSTAVWLLIDTKLSEHPYTHPLIPYWNSAVRLALFLITTQFLALMKSQLDREQNLSRTDGLTGLMNGRGFAEAAEKLFELAARHGRPTCLAYFDLDNFKQVNDRLGHSEGDKVLRTVGEILLKTLRKTEVAGRLGGDEFAIVLPETNEAGAQAVFNNLRNNLAHAMQKSNWQVGFSIGVISFDTPPSNLDEAIKLADALMYKIKNNGKNNILFEHYSRENIYPATSEI